MILKELWNTDTGKAYELFQEFPECDHGFENIAFGMDYESFISLVERKRLNSIGKELPEGFVPDTVFILIDNDEDILRH